jgi:phosphatidylglycerol---prolipoprotein diacylglyceryl transferase
MIPTLVHIGPIPIYTFGLMIALAVFVAVPVLTRSFARNGLPEELAERYAVWGGVGGLIGARLWNMAEHYSSTEGSLIDALINTAGFTFYGGFITSAILLSVLAWKDGLRIRDVFGSVGPALAIGYALGRLGCQLSGDGDYGMATSSWIGMSYETGVVPTPPGVRVYPTPIFEGLASLLVWYILERAERGSLRSKPLMRGALYLVLMSTERFVVEFYRIEARYLFGWSEAQFIALGLFTLGAGLLCTEKSFREANQSLRES